MLEPKIQGWRQASEWLAGKRIEIRALAVVATLLVIVPIANWTRNAPALIAPPAVEASGPPSAAVPTGVPGAVATPDAGVLYVHVAGAVRQPGLYELPIGARVVDAIEAAGGATERADVDALNLAALLVDATKVEVPKKGADAAPVAPSPGASAGPSAPIDLNTADQTLLETIPGVGPVTATAILQYRSEVGAFESVDELLEVDGIGPTTLESLRSYVTV